MDSGKFDYGGPDEASTQDVETPAELADLYRPSDSQQQPRRPSRLLNAELDVRVTVQAVVALLLLTLAVGLLTHNAWSRRVRDTAFQQMVEGTSQREYLRTIEAAESFLTHQPLNGSIDPREGGVVSLYSEALVHWIAQQPGKLDANAHARVARYKQLVKSPDK